MFTKSYIIPVKFLCFKEEIDIFLSNSSNFTLASVELVL
jgi:hypothetical protein